LLQQIHYKANNSTLWLDKVVFFSIKNQILVCRSNKAVRLKTDSIQPDKQHPSIP